MTVRTPLQFTGRYPHSISCAGKPVAEIQRAGQPPRILSLEEQEKMRTVCRVSKSGCCIHSFVLTSLVQLTREVLDIAAAAIRPGITTDEIDEIVHNATIERNAYPSPLGYRNFPKSVCTSVSFSLKIDLLSSNRSSF